MAFAAETGVRAAGVPPMTAPSAAPAGPTGPRPVLVVAGPTASGKSRLALDLARGLGGTVINADSQQVYTELAIITARPGPAELAAAPHRLYGTIPAADVCSAARWRDLALTEIAAAHGAGRVPILVGGTGLYLRALMDGMVALPPIPDAVRAEAADRYDTLGGERFRAALASIDPHATRLAAGDRQRLIRAWEVVTATGQTLSAWQAASAATGAPPDLTFCCLVILPPRKLLYAACDARFQAMMAAGALAEVARLDALGLDPGLPAMKALGVPELRGHLHGACPLPTAVAAVQRATRHYAKRQVTWFRHQLIARLRTQPTQRWLALHAQYSESHWADIITFVLSRG